MRWMLHMDVMAAIYLVHLAVSGNLPEMFFRVFRERTILFRCSDKGDYWDVTKIAH
jgi:hypothetical protein